MKPTMRKTLTLLLLGTWAVAIAQAPPGGEQAAGAEAGGQDPPCVPSGDALQAPDGESGPLDSRLKDTGQASVPCEEMVPKIAAGEEQTFGEAPDGSAADAGANLEEAPDVEISADEVFRPTDEISVDYPVPLPSDI